jgi:DNA-binding SARP family transcriptional activator
MASIAPVGDRTALCFVLFGGVRAWRGLVELSLGAPRQRALLQVLLVAGGEPVSLGEILTALWTDEPAATATNQVHRHVGELRRRLEPDLGRREVGRWHFLSTRRREYGATRTVTRRHEMIMHDTESLAV